MPKAKMKNGANIVAGSMRYPKRVTAPNPQIVAMVAERMGNIIPLLERKAR